MTPLDGFAVGATLALLLVAYVVVPIAQRIAKRRQAALERRVSDQRVRATFALIVNELHRKRPRGGFDMPPQDILRKRMIEDALLGHGQVIVVKAQ